MFFERIANKESRRLLERDTILLTLAGSRSYGTNHETSDFDYRGVLILPQEDYLSFRKPTEQIMWKEESRDEEGTVYEIRKFFNLALQCNPNIIECLFVHEDHIVFINDIGKELRSHRDIFLSQIAHKSFLGYARSQLKRIKTHKSWIDSPPQKIPERKDFGLLEAREIPLEQMNAVRAYVMRHTESMVPWLLEADNLHKEAFWEGVIWLVSNLTKERGKNFDKTFETWLEIEEFSQGVIAETLGFDQNFVELLRREKAYLQAVNHWKQYEGWKKNRNVERAKLESEYGFDLKHAMHLVRLMKMGEEILTTGRVNVYRDDRDDLLEIRNGDWTFDQLIEWFDDKTAKLNQLVHKNKTVLPKFPDYEEAERLLIRLIKMKN